MLNFVPEQCTPFKKFFPVRPSGLRRMNSCKNRTDPSERMDTLDNQSQCDGNKVYEIKLNIKNEEIESNSKNVHPLSKTEINFSNVIRT